MRDGTNDARLAAFLRASEKPKYGYWRAARRAHGEHCARSALSVRS